LYSAFRSEDTEALKVLIQENGELNVGLTRNLAIANRAVVPVEDDSCTLAREVTSDVTEFVH